MAIVLPWMLYLTRKDNINSQAIAVINNTQQNINDDLKNLSNRLEKLEDKIDKIYEMLHSRSNGGRRH